VLTWLSSALVALKFFLLMLATSCRTCANTTCPKLTTMLALQRAGPRVTASSAPLRGSPAAHELEAGERIYLMPRTFRRPQVRPAPPLP
jgi:CRISPR/Cas system endoribonuclease Cas6 (RAMP superfamily)